jgi:drug/metabolite transporter (DMT)-like permease
MLPVAAIFDQPWQLPMPHPATWVAIIGLAALSTALAYIVFFQVLRRSGATNVMLVTLIIPVTAILLGYFVGTRPSIRSSALQITSAPATSCAETGSPSTKLFAVR